MKTIPLTQGKVALVDDADYEWLRQWKWCAKRQPNKNAPDRWYAVRGTGGHGNFTLIRMHRVVLGLPPGRVPEVDHKDGDGLNNQRANLREASSSQNLANKDWPRPHGLKGITPTGSRTRPWMAQIRAGKQSLYLGSFRTAEEAARAYDIAARERYGEFARLNFPEAAA